jgi:putative hydroxymethylpyrimidine transport system substrate-binding protein
VKLFGRYGPQKASLVVLVAAVAGLPSACGGDQSESSEATLVLDFVPNAVHAGIYRALGAGYYEAEGIDLKVVEPSATADTLRLIEAGRADFGIADAIDVATQIGQGRDVKGVMALLQRPAGGVITLAESGVDSPSDLEGRQVAITGVPSDEAVLDAVVAGDGGDPERVRTITVGFKGAQSLLAGRVDAFTGFVAADGAQVEAAGEEVRAFPLDRWSGVRYPGLVVFTTGERIAADPDLIEGFVGATVRGYEDTLGEPDRSLDDLVEQNPSIDRELAAATFERYREYFTVPGHELGVFDRGDLRDLSRFMLDTGLAERPFSPGRYATNAFVERVGG